MIKVELVCEIDSPAGYSAHARLMLRALHEYNLAEHDIALRLVHRKKEAMTIHLSAFDRQLIAQYLQADFEKPDVRIFFEPAHFADFEEDVTTIIFSQWETTQICGVGEGALARYNWVAQMNKADGIITSCSDASRAFYVSGVNTPITVIPGPIFPHVPAKCELMVSNLTIRGDEFIPREKRPKVIGYMAQWSPRKNMEAFIRDVTIAFTNDQACGLIKTYDYDFHCRARIVQAIRAIRDQLRKPNSPTFYLITEQLTDEEILAFFELVDIYYAPSHGEGFSLPVSMAVAAGKRVIVPDFGGPRDYLPQSCLVRGSYTPAGVMSAFRWDQFWFSLDEEEAVQKLKTAYAGNVDPYDTPETVLRNAIDIAGPAIFARNIVDKIKYIHSLKQAKCAIKN